MPRKRKESPVEIGDTVFVVDDRTFEVNEAVVVSNPSDHIWVRTVQQGKPKKGAPKVDSYFVGPHRWATTEAEAKRIAKRMAQPC